MRWHYHGGISRVDTCKFDVLEHPTDHSVFAVGDTVDIKFVSVFEEFIEKHRGAWCDIKNFAHDFLHFVHIIDYEHTATPKNEGWAKKDREADFSGTLVSFFEGIRYAVFWLF